MSKAQLENEVVRNNRKLLALYKERDNINVAIRRRKQRIAEIKNKISEIKDSPDSLTVLEYILSKNNMSYNEVVEEMKLKEAKTKEREQNE